MALLITQLSTLPLTIPANSLNPIRTLKKSPEYVGPRKMAPLFCLNEDFGTQ